MNPASRTYVGEIDSLRCFAMSMVMLLHAGLLPFGWLGVWLFFVISGFAITTSLISDTQAEAPRRVVVGHFYYKRALRILPLYLAYIAAVSIYAAWLHLATFWPALPYLGTFTYNLAIALGSPTIAAPAVVQLWSISGEEQFYLIFPFLFLFLQRRAFISALALILLVCPIARAMLAAAVGGDPMLDVPAARAVMFFTPVHFDAFAAGALIALVTHGRSVSRRVGRIALAAGMGALALYVVSYTVLQASAEGAFTPFAVRGILSGQIVGQYREVFGFTAIWMASAGVILAVLAKLPSIATICRPRLFRSIGRVSYGGYVYHGFVTEVLSRFWPALRGGALVDRLAFFVLLYGLTMIVALASYRWLEKPFLKLKPRRPGTSSLAQV